MTRPTAWFIASVACLGLVRAAIAADAPPSAGDLDFFEKKVRPVLVERCYKCHSTESEKVKGHLLLDSREGTLKGGDSGPAIVPGQPDKSLLVEAIQYKNPETEMPPKGKLPQAEIDVLVKWVEMGAPDPRTGGKTLAAKKPGMSVEEGRRFWSYQPIKASPAPALKNAAWPKNDLDRFVLAKLEAQGLKPAADADPATLVRRLYFDLTGLPPTPAEIDAYLADKKADRYERLVDQLLASPRFGERWGRHWLDVARYGESLTLRGFILKDAWRYRDYVIESFNADRPFDRFMQEQIAGDLMTADSIDERRRQIVGTSFLAIGNTNLEEQDKKQLEMDVVDEQLDTMGRAFLGQTIGCARCHDHKFDPISSQDYYGLAGILHSTTTLEHANVSKWLEMPLPLEPAQAEQVSRQEAAVADLQARIKTAKASMAKAGKAEGAALALQDLPGIVIDNVKAKRVGSWKDSTSVKPYLGDGYLTDDGDRGENKSLTFMPEMIETGRYEVRFAYVASKNRATNVNVTVFSADGEKTIPVNERVAPTIGGHFVSLGVHTFEKSGQGFVIVSNQGVDGHVIADAVQFIPEDAAATADAVAAAPAASPAAQAKALEVKQLEAQLKKLTESGPKRATAISVRESKTVGNTRVHVRGSVHTLGDEVPRGFMRVIDVKRVPAIPADQSGRRELAEWLANPENPLPARVMANRAWHWLFGAGIVRTTDNFGTTGELPSHPELLDHLADGFIRDGWSVKSLVRRIVLSHTYRLASGAADPKALAADPENRLLSHANRRRMDAECIRDAMLAVAGTLNLDVAAGPSYNPETKSDFGYKDEDTRRSVYVPAFRNALPELFEVFDIADPSVCTGRRNVSTVAPQALYLLNHPFVLEQSEKAAGRLLAQSDEDRAKIVAAYRSALGRPPTDAENELAWQFVKTAEDSKKAWAELFHALFASVDFRYVD